MNLNRTIGNILGCSSIAIALFLWAFILSTAPQEFHRSVFNAGFRYSILSLFIFSLVLPPFASWRGSKLWLLMLLNPAAWLLFLELRP